GSLDEWARSQAVSPCFRSGHPGHDIRPRCAGWLRNVRTCVGASAWFRSAVLIPETMSSIALAVAVVTLLLAVVALWRERRARSAAQIAQSRFLAMMEATGFGVLMVDESGRIAYANNSAADI